MDSYILDAYSTLPSKHEIQCIKYVSWHFNNLLAARSFGRATDEFMVHLEQRSVLNEKLGRLKSFGVKVSD